MTVKWIQTYSGKQFWPLNPQIENIDIKDIAHSLSMQCRFNGHCLSFYSVAEHSVRVSNICPAEYKLWGLLHDAGEAYASDIPRPIKCQIDGYDSIEESILKIVAAKYNLCWPVPPEVLEADNIILATEARDIMSSHPDNWFLPQEPMKNEHIVPCNQRIAELMFLDEFNKLFI